MPKRFSIAFIVVFLAFVGYYLSNIYLSSGVNLQEQMKLYASVEKRSSSVALAFRDENNSNKLVKEFSPADLSASLVDHAGLGIEISGWNSAHTELWGKVLTDGSYNETVFFVLPSKNFLVTKYDMQEKTGLMPLDTVVNPDKRAVAYSDYVNQSGATDAPNVTLYLLNLKTGEKKTMETVIAKPFNPYWLNEDTLQYNNHYGEGKTTFSLADTN